MYTSRNLCCSSLCSHLFPSGPPCSSCSTVELPVMELRDRAEKLEKSTAREAYDENPVTAALITRAQAFVLSAEKRQSQGKCVFRTRLIWACLPLRTSVWMRVCIKVRKAAMNASPNTHKQHLDGWDDLSYYLSGWTHMGWSGGGGRVWGSCLSSSHPSPSSHSSPPASSDFAIIHTRWKILMDAGRPLVLSHEEKTEKPCLM